MHVPKTFVLANSHTDTELLAYRRSAMLLLQVVPLLRHPGAANAPGLLLLQVVQVPGQWCGRRRGSEGYQAPPRPSPTSSFPVSSSSSSRPPIPATTSAAVPFKKIFSKEKFILYTQNFLPVGWGNLEAFLSSSVALFVLLLGDFQVEAPPPTAQVLMLMLL